MDDKILDQLLATYNIDAATLERLHADFLELWSEPLEDWVRLRHLALQKTGLSNESIYHRIMVEKSQRRFPSQDLSLRQIRRIIYG